MRHVDLSSVVRYTVLQNGIDLQARSMAVFTYHRRT